MMLQNIPFSNCWLLPLYQQIQLVMLNKNVSLDFCFYMDTSVSKYITVILCCIFFRFSFHQVLLKFFLFVFLFVLVTGSTVILEETTLMPPIPGLLALLSMLFAPAIELRYSCILKWWGFWFVLGVFLFCFFLGPSQICDRLPFLLFWVVFFFFSAFSIQYILFLLM